MQPGAIAPVPRVWPIQPRRVWKKAHSHGSDPGTPPPPARGGAGGGCPLGHEVEGDAIPAFGGGNQVPAHPRHSLGAGCRWPRGPLIHFFTPHKSSIGPLFAFLSALLRSMRTVYALTQPPPPLESGSHFKLLNSKHRVLRTHSPKPP